MEFWNDIYKLYGIVLDLRELLGRLINGRLGEYEKGPRLVMEKDWLPEQLRTIKNLCDTALLAIENKRRELLPTILELIYVEIQTVIDGECVIGEAEIEVK